MTDPAAESASESASESAAGRPSEAIVVIEPVHYGVGVRTFFERDPGGSVPHVSFDAAIAHWQSQGWTAPELLDDAYGRYRLRVRRDV